MEKPSILIVEDEFIVARDIRARVVRQGYGVTEVVSTGEEAVELVGRKRPDLVLMDIKLGGAMDGVEAAERIRELYGVPVVYLTAYADDVTLQRAKVTDPFGYLLKPFEERELHITIEMAFYKHRMEAKLRDREEQYRLFFEDDLTGDYIATAAGAIEACNPAFARIFGFASVEEARGANIAQLAVSPAQHEAFLDLLRRRGRLTYNERELVRRDGAPVHVVENVFAELDERGGLIRFKGYMFDDTERKRLEEQLRQAQKMESIGTLASGVAHDFNNILNTVLGFAAQIQKYADDPSRVAKYGQTIEKSAGRGAELCQKLLSFARKGKRERIPTNFAEIVNEVSSLCRGTFPRTIDIVTRVDARLHQVLGDRAELYQVVLNLCVNARDALAAHTSGSLPRLVIEARNLPQPTVRPALAPPADDGAWIEVTVADNGCGIAESIRDKIFDPFFTTKKDGQGTGLGLSMVYTIVRNHGGDLSFESREGVGTTFRILLPAVDRPAETASRPGPALGQRGGTETILVVDDEESMLELGRELLQEQGYRVLLAANGLQAMEIYRARAAEIALVLLDLVMPGMDGHRTFLEMKNINPDIKAVFCTGFMPDDIVRNLPEREQKRIIQKPFDPRTLFSMIRTVLDAPVGERSPSR